MKPNDIINCVCTYYNISPELLKSRTRTAKVAEARHLAHYLIRERCHILTIAQIGTYTHRSHATVLHSLDRIDGVIYPKVLDKTIAKELADLNRDLDDFYNF